MNWYLEICIENSITLKKAELNMGNFKNINFKYNF